MFGEAQEYRIDHYLGKPAVQNLMALRFANALFEPLWRRESIANIQITLAEGLGVGTRGDFYDRTGALRVGEVSVVVAVSAPHRDAAFTAARWCIDTLKETVPIWKREAWDGRDSWGLEAQHIVGVSESAP